MCLLLYIIKRMVVGDFGLATSSLAAVDPSDVSPHAVARPLGRFFLVPLHPLDHQS